MCVFVYWCVYVFVCVCVYSVCVDMFICLIDRFLDEYLNLQVVNALRLEVEELEKEHSGCLEETMYLT